MPHLTDTAIKRAKPRDRTFKTYDSKGLYLEITPKGSKRWRFRYRFGGKEKLLSVGIYPTVSLRAARKARDEARELLRDGIDPSERRKLEKLVQADAAERSFLALCESWRTKVEPKLSESSMGNGLETGRDRSRTRPGYSWSARHL